MRWQPVENECASSSFCVAIGSNGGIAEERWRTPRRDAVLWPGAAIKPQGGAGALCSPKSRWAAPRCPRSWTAGIAARRRVGALRFRGRRRDRSALSMTAPPRPPLRTTRLCARCRRSQPATSSALEPTQNWEAIRIGRHGTESDTISKATWRRTSRRRRRDSITL